MAWDSVRAPACRTWNIETRTACCSAGSPSISTSLRSQKRSRYSRCCASRSSQPASLATPSEASTWSRSAAADRRLDQPYPSSFTTRSRCPGTRWQVTVIRARSAPASMVATASGGASSKWSIPAATRSPLRSVRWTRTARRSWLSASSACSGRINGAGSRGSLDAATAPSLARRSDWSAA
jgi:hypothetical protein